MLAAGVFCITAGDIVSALYDRVLHHPAPFPSLADAVYLAGCPMIGLSLVLLVRTRTAGRDRVSWIDATIVASGFGLLSWVGLLIDVPWLLGFVLFGATGLHPSMGELTQPVAEPTTRLTWRRLGLLTGASLIAPILLLSQTLLARGRVDGSPSAPPRCCCSCWWYCESSGWSGRWRSKPSSSPLWPGTMV
jgi:hypothetical protein